MAETRLIGSRIPEGLLAAVREVVRPVPGETEAAFIRRALAHAAGVDPNDYPARPVGRPIVHGRRSRKYPQAA